MRSAVSILLSPTTRKYLASVQRVATDFFLSIFLNVYARLLLLFLWKLNIVAYKTLAINEEINLKLLEIVVLLEKIIISFVKKMCLHIFCIFFNPWKE